MIGFIKGLFGPKAKSGDSSEGSASPETVAPQKTAQKTAQKKAQAFFLDADNAKTYGNIDYMRMSKAVRRTFPKTLANPDGFERNVEISAEKKMSLADSRRIIEAPTEPKPTAAPAENGARRNTDTNMDMFRNMARDIKKR